MLVLVLVRASTGARFSLFPLCLTLLYLLLTLLCSLICLLFEVEESVAASSGDLFLVQCDVKKLNQ